MEFCRIPNSRFRCGAAFWPQKRSGFYCLLSISVEASSYWISKHFRYFYHRAIYQHLTFYFHSVTFRHQLSSFHWPVSTGKAPCAAFCWCQQWLQTCSVLLLWERANQCQILSSVSISRLLQVCTGQYDAFLYMLSEQEILPHYMQQEKEVLTGHGVHRKDRRRIHLLHICS